MPLASPDSPFGHASFRRLWSSRIASTFAMQVQTVAIGWQMYALTHQVLDLGLIGLAQFLPALLLTIPAGTLADRHARQRILRVTLAIRAIALVAVTFASFHDAVTREGLFAFAIVIGTMRAFEMPAQSALLSQTVPASLLSSAVAWSASANEAAIIVGPALGGFVYVAGPDAAYGLAAVFGVAAFLAMTSVDLPAPAQAPGDTRGLTFMLGGLQYIRTHPTILGAMSLDMVAVLFGGASAMLPVYAHDILQTGPWGLGLLRAAEGIGALSVAVLLARRPLLRRVGRSMFIGVACFGIAIVVFAVSHWFLLSFAALLVLGGADMISVVVRQSLVQLDTPNSMRGRVGAVSSLFIGTSNQLGEFRAGAMAAWVGVMPAVALGGLAVLGVAALWTRLFPQLLARDTLASPDPPVTVGPPA